MAHQLVLEIPDEVYQTLERRAQSTGQSVEAVANAWLAEAVRQSTPVSDLRNWIGAFDSGVPDAALRHDEYLGQALYEELRGKPDE